MGLRFHPRPGNALVRNYVHSNFDIHRSLQRVAVQFAIALHGVSVAEVQQCAGNIHRQIDRRALDNFIEVHVSPVMARIARARSGLRDPGSYRDASQHRPKWNGIAR